MVKPWPGYHCAKAITTKGADALCEHSRPSMPCFFNFELFIWLRKVDWTEYVQPWSLLLFCPPQWIINSAGLSILKTKGNEQLEGKLFFCQPSFVHLNLRCSMLGSGSQKCWSNATFYLYQWSCFLRLALHICIGLSQVRLGSKTLHGCVEW